jgi:hypothetical protein
MDQTETNRNMVSEARDATCQVVDARDGAPAEQPDYLDDVTQAKKIGVSVSFLRKDRRTARRIPFIRLQGRILYDPERVRQALLALEEGGPFVKRIRRERVAGAA